MLQTSARLLRLLTLLQARESWSGPELCERLEVIPRTLRRDVDRLRTLGYPVHSSSGIAGGYRLGAGATLPPLMLDDDEGLAVAVGLGSAAGGTVSGIEDASQRALAKLEVVLPARLRRRLANLRSSILRLADTGPTVALGAVAALAAACSERAAVRFRYRDHQGGDSVRTVEPHRLVHMERRWYLVAWDQARKDWRTFRVDRIGAPAPTGARFASRAAPDDDVGSYVTRSVSWSPYRHHARVIVRAPIETLRERISAASGRLERIDKKSCRLYVGAPSLDALAVILGALGADFQVEEPRALVPHLRGMAARLRRAAGATSG